MTRGCGSKPPAPRFPFCWAKQNGGYPKTGIWVLTQLVVERAKRPLGHAWRARCVEGLGKASSCAKGAKTKSSFTGASLTSGFGIKVANQRFTLDYTLLNELRGGLLTSSRRAPPLSLRKLPRVLIGKSGLKLTGRTR